MSAREKAWQFLSPEALKDVAGEWDALVASRAQDHPLLNSAFLVSLIEHFGTDTTMLVIQRPTNGTGACSGAILQKQRFGRWETFSPPQLPLCPVLVDDCAGLANALFRLSLAASISFFQVDGKYQSIGSVGGARVHSVDHGTTMAVDVGRGEFAHYWAERSKSLRKNIKRYVNKVNQEGAAPRYVVTRAIDEMEDAVLRYAKVESAGWKGEIGTALSPGCRQTRFYTDCLKRFARQGLGSVHELYFGDKIAASRLCVERAGIFVILKTTYDETLAKFAPGRLLLFELLKDMFERSTVRVVEFYTNANSDQLLWASESRAIRNISAYRNHVISGLARLRHASYRRKDGA